MKASQMLPAGYIALGQISLKEKKWLIWLNVLALPWAMLCASFFVTVTIALRPDTVALRRAALPVPTSWGVIGIVGGFLLLLGAVLVLHELVHGLFFWLFTRSRPVFGFRGWYAYAAAPAWYLPRGAFLVVLAAPLVLLSVFAEALVLMISWAVVPWVVGGLICNAVGAIGDLSMIVRFMFAPRVGSGEKGNDVLPFPFARGHEHLSSKELPSALANGRPFCYTSRCCWFSFGHQTA